MQGVRVCSSVEPLDACFSGRPWRRGGERIEIGCSVLVLGVQVVSFFALASSGRGGMASGDGRWVWVVVLDGAAPAGSEVVLVKRSCGRARSMRKIPSPAADGLCGRLQ